MKKYLCTMLILLVLLLSVCGCSNDKVDEETQEDLQNELLDIFGGYKHTFNKNCYIVAHDSDEYELFIRNGSALRGLFYKYAYNNDGYLAVCNLTNPRSCQVTDVDDVNMITIHGLTYSYDKMQVCLYNSDMTLIGTYDDYKSFSNELRRRKIKFEKWYYREAGYSNTTDLTTNAYIEDAGRRGMTLFVNDEMFLLGRIREYAVINQNCFAVLFEEGEYDYAIKDSKIKLNEKLDRERFGKNASIKDSDSLNPFKKTKVYGAVIVVNCNEDGVNIAEYESRKSFEKETGITVKWIKMASKADK